MDILLDTCTVLWYFNGDESIPQATREIILNPENAIYVSLATIMKSLFYLTRAFVVKS